VNRRNSAIWQELADVPAEIDGLIGEAKDLLTI